MSSVDSWARSTPSNMIRPEMFVVGDRVRPRMVMLATLFPQPDSPTIPSVWPRSTAKDAPSTAFTTPSSVSKWTLRSWISSRLTSASLVPHPRVEVGIGDVDDQVEDDDEEGAEQGHALDHGQVGALDRGEY